MAANQLIASMPFLSLDTGCTVTVEAIDPATGAAVAGVTVSQVAFAYPDDSPDATPDDAYDSLYTQHPGGP